MKHRFAIAAAILACLALPGETREETAAASAGAVSRVTDDAALLRASTAAYPGGVWRDDYGEGVGAPPLFFAPQNGTCAKNRRANDGGSCVDAKDGNSWKARFPTGKIDVREFGAKPDDATPADGAVAAAIAYAKTTHGCAYLPAVAPGFKFTAAIAMPQGGCLVGDRFQGWVPYDRTVPYSMLHFPNDTDGIRYDGSPTGQYNFYIANLSLAGNAAQSAVATHTNGLLLSGAIEGVVENLFISNFVVCQHLSAPNGRNNLRNIDCNDQQAYPNIVNDFPYACEQLDNGGTSSAVNAAQHTGGLCRAASWAADAVYSGDGATRRFDVTANVNGPPLWRADGIKVRVGPQVPTPPAPLQAAGALKICGLDYSIWDISASGGGGVELFCRQTTATVKSGTLQLTVPSTKGYRSGPDILVVADHGLPLATKVASIDDATHLTLTKAPYISGTLAIRLVQENIGSSGGRKACQTTHSCGSKIEVRFNAAPPRGRNNVDLQWSDPTGYAAIDAEAVSDYLLIQPMFVGGYDVGLKHVGLSDGGIEFRPTYIEILDQCASIESQTYGDVAIFHRIINDPIPDCPGYVDPAAGPTIIGFNNHFRYLNGADIVKQ